MPTAAAVPPRTVLVVLATAWDREELAAERYHGRYRFVFRGGHPEETEPGFEPLRFVRETAAAFRGDGVAGVIGTDDYLACVLAPAIAAELGLPGPAPRAVLHCQHKYYSRCRQRELVPEATPAFVVASPWEFHLEAPPVPYPFFMKPVRGTFSVLAKRMDGPHSFLEVFQAPPGPSGRGLRLLDHFHCLLRHYGGGEFTLDGRRLLLEEIAEGAQVTVEGFVHRGRTTVLGVVDSVFFPGTLSFRRFDYPSRLPAAVQERMAEVAARLMEGIGYDQAFFNVEFFYDERRDRLRIIEVNPRLAYQFADLYEKVDGCNAYDLVLALATGEEPRFRRRAGAFAVASSYVLRTFRNAHVRRVPRPDEVAALQRRFPDLRLKLYARAGGLLSETMQDGASYRYGLVHLGGADRADLDRRIGEVEAGLKFEFEPL